MKGKKRPSKKNYVTAEGTTPPVAAERCVNCGKALPEDSPLEAHAHTRAFPVCSESCKTETEDYVQRDKRLKWGLYGILLVCAVIILGGAIFSSQGALLYVAILLAGMGFFFFPYPITSFETFYACSIRTVKLICRVLGVVLVVMAAVLLFLNF